MIYTDAQRRLMVGLARGSTYTDIINAIRECVPVAYIQDMDIRLDVWLGLPSGGLSSGDAQLIVNRPDYWFMLDNIWPALCNGVFDGIKQPQVWVQYGIKQHLDEIRESFYTEIKERYYGSFIYQVYTLLSRVEVDYTDGIITEWLFTRDELVELKVELDSLYGSRRTLTGMHREHYLGQLERNVLECNRELAKYLTGEYRRLTSVMDVLSHS